MSSFQRVPYGIHPTNTYWEDIDFPIIIRTTGPSRPALTPVKGTIEAPLWLVGDNLQIEGQEIIHGYREGSAIQWHIHLITADTDTTDRFVNFQVEWTWANAFGQLPDVITTVSGDLLIPANTPAGTMVPREIELVEMPDLKIGAHIWARLTRIASTGTAPTGNIFASMLQLHVECDSQGSTEIFEK